MTATDWGLGVLPRGPSWRWGAGLAVALALHVLAAFALLAWRDVSPPAALVPAAILLDLPPQPAPAPPAPVQEEPPKPIPEAQPLPKPPEPVPPPPRPVHRPVIHRAVPQEPPTPTVSESEPPQPSPAAPPVEAAPAAPATPAPPPASPSVGVVSFEALLTAHLERFRRYPAAALRRGEQGTAYLRFVIDRQGRVLSFRLERSSGHPALDEEVLALIRRAQPLPPIPDNIPQSQLELVAPVRFVLK